MKLSEITTRDKVPTGAPGDATNRFWATPGPNAAAGWSLTLEAGIVTMTKGDLSRLVPMGNIAFAVPEAPEAAPVKPVKAAPKAAA